MFKNPGNKIKSWAKVLFVVLLIIGLITIVVAGEAAQYSPEYIANPASFRTALIIVCIIAYLLYAILAYVGCLLVYGYGELIDNSKAINEEIDEQKRSVEMIRGDTHYIFSKLYRMNERAEERKDPAEEQPFVKREIL